MTAQLGVSQVLVVDDIAENRYLLVALLEGHGYRVVSTTNGAEAWEAAQQSAPALLITDLLMPVMDGFELCRRWKQDERFQRIPLIAYTATYTDAKDEELALSLGADRFLLKPQQPELLLQVVRELLERGAPRDAGQPLEAPRDAAELLRLHNDALIRRLQHKVTQLESEIERRRQVESSLHASEIKLRASETAALEARAQLQAVFDHAPDLILSIDREGAVSFANRSHPLHTTAPVNGSSWLAYVAPEQQAALTRLMAEVLATGESRALETVTTGDDARPIWISNHLGPVLRNGHTTGVVLIGRDVTEKRITETQLIASDRMAAVGMLAAGVAHEINNPLAAIIANLDLALREMADLMERQGLPTHLEHELRDARDCADRIRTIARDLRIFSRAEEERRGPVDTKAVLESTLRMVWNEIRHRARLVKHYGEVPPVEANESRLGQVFLNLLVNAAQALPDGRVETNEIRVSTRLAADGYVVVEVADTGSGMTPEVRRRLFTPFFTTKPAGVGTGLGLAICHRIITGLGGKIEVASELGKGTAFRLYLPRASSEELQSPASAGAGTAARRRGRILVVDDEVVLGRVIRRAFSNDHEVVTATRAQDALNHLAAGQRFDVILCDLMMPDLSGEDFHDELLLALPDQAQRVIFMTGGAFTARAREFLERVPNVSFEKPFDLQQLRELVHDRIR